MIDTKFDDNPIDDPEKHFLQEMLYICRASDMHEGSYVLLVDDKQTQPITKESGRQFAVREALRANTSGYEVLDEQTLINQVAIPNSYKHMFRRAIQR